MSCSNPYLATKPELSRFVFYKMFVAIPLLAALVAMFRHAGSIFWPLGYVCLCLAHAFVMYAIKCPHCAYYKLGDKKHRCFMIWGAPKIWKAREGPESRLVGIYAPLGVLAITVFPLYWLGFQWELLVIYLLGIVTILMSIGQVDCRRCLQFDCAHNSVPEEVKSEYRKGAA